MTHRDGRTSAQPTPSPPWLCCTARVAVGGKGLRLRRMRRHRCVHVSQTSPRSASATPCGAQSMGAGPGTPAGEARGRHGADCSESGPARSRPVSSGVFHVKRCACRRPFADLSEGREGPPCEVMTGTRVGPRTNISAPRSGWGRISRCYPVWPTRPRTPPAAVRGITVAVAHQCRPEWAENERRRRFT